MALAPDRIQPTFVPPLRRAGRDFFDIQGDVIDIDQAAFFEFVNSNDKMLEDRLYRPNDLGTVAYPLRARVRGKTFVNISLSKTYVKDLEFVDCRFLRCLFIGTIFENCRFANCEFTDSNPFRIEFRSSFIDPRSFRSCLSKYDHMNIGVYLYQDLLRNSRQQVQPDFSDYSLYQFRKWQRYLLIGEAIANAEFSFENIRRIVSIVLLYLFDVSMGSGMRLSQLVVSLIFTIAMVTTSNYYFASYLGLCQNKEPLKSLTDAFYFTSITMTTLGYGDILPTERLGRIVVSLEAMLGLVLLALLTSTLYCRISS